MSIDIKEMRDDVAEARETAANAATGAAVSVIEAVTHPVTSARKEVRRLAREGEPVNSRLNRKFDQVTEDAVEAATDVVSGNLAERIALGYFRMLRNRSRKQDMVGNVLHTGLGIFNTVLDGTAKELGKFQAASQPPARNSRSSHSTTARRSTARRARSTTARASRTAQRTTRSTANRVRRTASRTANQARRTVSQAS